MAAGERYTPGSAFGAEVRRAEGSSTLVLVRELRHSPEMVWGALTDPAQLREWAPFDASRSLGSPGRVTLTTVGAPQEHITETEVRRADAPRLLEFDWGGQEIRWELSALPGGGTRLVLNQTIDQRYISMAAAGWHICLDVMDHLLDGQPIGRIVAGDAMNYEWPRLNAEYAQQFRNESAPGIAP